MSAYSDLARVKGDIAGVLAALEQPGPHTPALAERLGALIESRRKLERALEAERSNHAMAWNLKRSFPVYGADGVIHGIRGVEIVGKPRGSGCWYRFVADRDMCAKASSYDYRIVSVCRVLDTDWKFVTCYLQHGRNAFLSDIGVDWIRTLKLSARPMHDDLLKQCRG